MSTIATATATAAPATTLWNLDPTHSSVEFSVRHLMIATVKGRFTDVTGHGQPDETDPARGAMDITIDTATIDTRVGAARCAPPICRFLRRRKFPTADLHEPQASPTAAANQVKWLAT